MNPAFTKFLVRVAPELGRLATALFNLYRGNAAMAIGELKDRRAEIDRRRAQNDKELAAKYNKE